ncbi:MAG: hypothetical protein KAJ19_05845 [Gammaproteobacteria bacterium]|nr:hypothetical protein [Gammaproteobacteria bacterium]
MLKKPVCLLSALWLSVISLNAWADAGWTSYGIVKELSLNSSQQFQVRLYISSNPTDCKNEKWFYHDYKGVSGEQMYLTFLTGLTTGRKVRVYVTGKCNLNGYSNISEMSIIR